MLRRNWDVLSGRETASLRRERIRIETAGPHGMGNPILVSRKHLRLLALLAELVRGIDREQHRLAFGSIGAEFLPFERNEPKILPAQHKVPMPRRIGDHARGRYSFLRERSRHTVSSIDCRQ